jgi:hypothetical protein
MESQQEFNKQKNYSSYQAVLDVDESFPVGQFVHASFPTLLP